MVKPVFLSFVPSHVFHDVLSIKNIFVEMKSISIFSHAISVILTDLISGCIRDLLTLPYLLLFLDFTFNDKEDYILKECVNTPAGDVCICSVCGSLIFEHSLNVYYNCRESVFQQFHVL